MPGCMGELPAYAPGHASMMPMNGAPGSVVYNGTATAPQQVPQQAVQGAPQQVPQGVYMQGAPIQGGVPAMPTGVPSYYPSVMGYGQ